MDYSEEKVVIMARALAIAVLKYSPGEDQKRKVASAPRVYEKLRSLPENTRTFDFQLNDLKRALGNSKMRKALNSTSPPTNSALMSVK